MTQVVASYVDSCCQCSPQQKAVEEIAAFMAAHGHATSLGVSKVVTLIHVMHCLISGGQTLRSWSVAAKAEDAKDQLEEREDGEPDAE